MKTIVESLLIFKTNSLIVIIGNLKYKTILD